MLGVGCNQRGCIRRPPGNLYLSSLPQCSIGWDWEGSAPQERGAAVLHTARSSFALLPRRVRGEPGEKAGCTLMLLVVRQNHRHEIQMR